MPPIPAGTYKPATTDNTYTTCAGNKQCTTTASESCDAMKYSISGQSYCTRVPIGYYV
jgi:hypothetical protein